MADRSEPTTSEAYPTNPGALPGAARVPEGKRRAVGLAIACALHAVPFALAAIAVPTEVASWFGLTAGLLALLHVAVAVLALRGRDATLARAWSLLALASLLWLLLLTFLMGSAALYLSALYRDIGYAVSAALACVWGLVVLFTVPISVWGLASVRPRWLLGPRAVAITAGVLLWVGASCATLQRRARAEPVHAGHSAALHDTLLGLARGHAADAPTHSLPSLMSVTPTPCDQPVNARRLTLLVSTLDLTDRPFAACLQAQTERDLIARLSRLLGERARPGSPLKLDLVQGVQNIPALSPLLQALALRPALDGVCARSCLAPWQLVARDAFTRYRPLDAVRDASFGVSLPELAQLVGAASPRELVRIETRSYIAQNRTMQPLVRLRPERVDTRPDTLARAVRLAAEHIVRAQRPNGTFRYLLDPFTGQLDEREVSLPRQAGTVFALCELVPGEATRSVAERALAQLAGFERRLAAMSALSDAAETGSLGQTALPLIAFLSCREHVGSRHDGLIGQLTRYVLAMQRPDGSFYPEMTLTKAEPVGAHENLYSAGQAVLALVLVEQLARTGQLAGLPDRAALHDAVERAMAHYGRAYWPKPLRSLFYLEENWHCLAARAALRSHRHDDYEQLCLDYVRFKRRLILDADEDTSPEHVGGYGLSDMFPPHSTASAGFAEALSAAIAVAHARGLDLREPQATLRSVLGFLVRQQWTRDNCFACLTGGEVIGGFSETSASPKIRIDYVQHAMAALGHGARALALAQRPGADAEVH
jgi:hypothetical protein